MDAASRMKVTVGMHSLESDVESNFHSQCNLLAKNTLENSRKNIFSGYYIDSGSIQ